MQSFEYITATVLSVAWSIVIWILAIGKMIVSGIPNYVIHYTNWSWTLSGIFFIIDAGASIAGAQGLLIDNISFMLWLVNGTAWMVFFLMFVVLRTNPEVLLNESKAYGGNYSLGFVFDMDRLFHVMPAIVLIIYMILRRDIIRASVRQFYDKKKSPLGSQIAYGVIAMASCLMVGGFYFATQDVKAVYGLDVNPGITVAVSIGSIALFNLLPFLMFINQIRTIHDHQKKKSKV